MRGVFRSLGKPLAAWLARPRHVHGTSIPPALPALQACLIPGDVLLVEGSSRISEAIKYLTQSTWSHAALYVGPLPKPLLDDCGEQACVVEADMIDGVRAVALRRFEAVHVRVCRPIRLPEQDRERVIAHAIARIGHRYDLKNVWDLARWLVPTPPVPAAWRRRMITFGSGDPTRAICSTLIAQAFGTVRYPILPVPQVHSREDLCPGCVEEILHAQHHSLTVPRDFDVSPYFEIVKPSLASGLDPTGLVWASDAAN